jgi:3-dehydroquinate dehydratase-2
MSKLIYVLNGSNLNLLGKREPHLYGTTTLDEVRRKTEALAHELGLECDFRQTNHEGVMVDWLQEAYEKDAAVIINPAGFSFSSIPVLDAVKLIGKPVIEVHITNIHKRDVQYRHSLISLAATGVICGLGPTGYLLAVRAVADALAADAGQVQAMR